MMVTSVKLDGVGFSKNKAKRDWDQEDVLIELFAANEVYSDPDYEYPPVPNEFVRITVTDSNGNEQMFDIKHDELARAVYQLRSTKGY